MMVIRALGAVLAAMLAMPAAAAVYEVGADGTMERLDAGETRLAVAVPIPPLARGVTAASRARAFRPEVLRAGDRYSVSPALIDAIAHVESRYDPAAVSPARAAGIMQLMPGTARELGVDPRDPAANIRGGTAYLRQLLNRFDGDLVRTIAAYNAGPGAVARAGSLSGGIPNYRETRNYVAQVMNHLAASAQ